MQRISKERENSVSQQELLMRMPLRQSVCKPQSEFVKQPFHFFSSPLKSQLPFWVSPQMMVHHRPGEPEGWCQLLPSWQHARAVFWMAHLTRALGAQASVGLKLWPM